jgi:sigma-B regulation protein RsbU (phosphoserine phosphatase)
MTTAEGSRLVPLTGQEPRRSSGGVRLDRIIRLAREVFVVPVVEIALVGPTVQFAMPPQLALGGPPMERSDVFRDAALKSSATIVVTDTVFDARFAGRPIDETESQIRFFAGRRLTIGEGERVGTICLVDTEPREFGDEQVRVLDELALWVERELKEDVDRKRAGLVQSSLLPAGPALGADVEVAGVSIPFHHVGGDFHSWSRDGSTVTVALADVMGKGVGAAIMAATVRATINTLGIGAPAETLRRTNELLVSDFAATGTFATAFVARLDLTTGELEYADAGHGLSILARSDGTHERLVSTGLPLGIAADVEFFPGSVELGHGDMLLTFTDGLLDLLDGTLESILPIVDIALQSSGAVEVVNRITELCRTLRATDDVTVVAVARPSLI